MTALGVDEVRIPRLLRAASALMELTEAVSVFHGVAVVLPLGSPVAPPRSAALGGWRRSRRDPWWSILRLLDEDEAGLALAIDSAPTDRLADKQLAKQVLQLSDARLRGAAITALGIGRLMEALAPRPVQEDAWGRLYQIGRAEDPSTFVEVRDRVLRPDGTPLQHWLGVTPHVATAREAVAWTFGMSEAEYRPAKES